MFNIYYQRLIWAFQFQNSKVTKIKKELENLNLLEKKEWV